MPPAVGNLNHDKAIRSALNLSDEVKIKDFEFREGWQQVTTLTLTFLLSEEQTQIYRKILNELGTSERR